MVDLSMPPPNGTIGSMPILAPLSASSVAQVSIPSSRKSSKGEKKDKKEKVAISSLLPEGVELIIIMPDGRVCKLCGVKDCIADYVNGKIYIKWAKPPKWNEQKQGYLNDGVVCYYCNKLLNGQYKAIYKTAEALLAAMAKQGKEGETLTLEFKEFRQLIQNECIKQGKYNIRIDNTMTQMAKKVVHREVRKVDVETSDYVVDPTWYISQFSHWETNGRGHRYGELEGEWGVIIPGAPVKKINRVLIYPNQFRTRLVFSGRALCKCIR